MIHPLESFKLLADSEMHADEMVVVGTPQKRMENIVSLIHSVDSKGSPVAISPIDSIWVADVSRTLGDSPFSSGQSSMFG